MNKDWLDPQDLTFPERLEQLERHARSDKIKVDDLPLAELQRKLARGWTPDGNSFLEPNSVGGDALGDGAIVAGESKLRVVRGEVNAAGAVVIGSGFTPVRNGAGDYTVTFGEAFSTVPVIVVSCGANAGALVAKLYEATAPTAALFRVLTFVTTTGTPTDSIFDFIAIGAN